MNALSDWPAEKAKAPASILSAARANPSGWVLQLDREMLPDPNGYAPMEAVVGAFEVNKHGKPTGIFRRNPDYGPPIKEDWSKLEVVDHYWGWLPYTPVASVLEGLDDIFQQLAPGTAIEWVKVLRDPVVRLGGPRLDGPESKMIVRRAGLAVEFATGVRSSEGHREFFTGCFTWVATGLDTPQSRHDRTWFDRDMRIAKAEELLDERVYMDSADA